MKYWQKYHMLKLLSSLPHSNTLILAHIIKNNFNRAYCTGSIVTGILGSQLMCAGGVRSK